MSREHGRRHAALPLMFASGFAALGYQIVWTQQSALWLGHEMPAVLAVVAAFFGGFALGSLLLGERLMTAARPLRWYVACELLIAAWALVLLAAQAPLSDWLLQFTGAQPSPLRQWGVAFAGTFVMLLPATAAMGASLPAMERLVAATRHDGRALAPLYAANTAGAVAGVLVTAFGLIERFGLARTALFCAGLNVLCALGAALVPRGAADPARRVPVRAAADGVRAPAPVPVIQLMVTGLLGIGYEVVVVRALCQVTEQTVYTFALLLAVYLVGTATGAALLHRSSRQSRLSADRTERLLLALAAACATSGASLWAAAGLKATVVAWLGPGYGAALAAEAALALVAFGPPTLAMGAVFSQLALESAARGTSPGRVFAANTLGAACAPLLFGVVAWPLVGARGALLAIVLGYLVTAAPGSRRWPALAAAGVAAVGVALLAPPLVLLDVPTGGHVVSHREGVAASVSIVEDGAGVATLHIDNRQQEGSSATRRVDGRQAWLPLLLHPAPRSALFLGLGTGVTARTAASDPRVHVVVAELLPEVIEAAAWFGRDDADAGLLDLRAADARRFVRTTPDRFDVIVSDNFHPARRGAGSLYTVEHFEAVRARLAAGGLFCQWLPLHQMDLLTLRSVVAAFLQAFPGAVALLASNSLDTPVIGLVGRPDGPAFSAASLRQRLAAIQPANVPAGFGIEDEYALLGSLFAGPAALRAFAGDAPVNTDDHTVVAYRAPRETYAPQSLPRDRLVELLSATELRPGELVAASEAGFDARLADYRRARLDFIKAGREVRPVADARAMIAQVGAPLLAVLRTSRDFRPAYDPLLRMATALAPTDSTAARALLTELDRLQPDRPEARAALDMLNDRSVTKASPELHGLTEDCVKPCRKTVSAYP